MSSDRDAVTRRYLRLINASAGALVVLLLINAVSGYAVFTRAEADPLAPVDVIVVLSGEDDGRQAYGLDLAEEGYARSVLISKTDRPNDEAEASACRPRIDFEVICRSAMPFTTRGEAIMSRELAEDMNWKTAIVVTSRYHLPRSRRIFEQCFVDATRSVLMQDVPRDYRFSVAEWQYTYFYQYVGWAKAELQGPCD